MTLFSEKKIFLHFFRFFSCEVIFQDSGNRKKKKFQKNFRNFEKIIKWMRLLTCLRSGSSEATHGLNEFIKRSSNAKQCIQKQFIIIRINIHPSRPITKRWGTIEYIHHFISAIIRTLFFAVNNFATTSFVVISCFQRVLVCDCH